MQRQSNIELLRCLSMFMVLLLHSSFLAFGMPEVEDIQDNPVLLGGRILQQGVSIVAVDVFVLISGWFSIKPKLKSICSFLFQVAFLKILSYVIFVSVGLVELNKETLTELLMLEPGQGWFIKAYLLLYVISPVLNVFSDKAEKGVFETVLIGYWTFSMFFGWIFNATSYINEGYSIVSFVGLYLLARYAKIWKPTWTKLSEGKYVVVYVLCVLLFSVVILTVGVCGIGKTAYVAWKLCSYISPLTVIGAMSLLLYFSKVSLSYNKWINLCGKSCFSIYLLHAMWGYWFDIIKTINKFYDGFIYVVVLLCFMLGVYLGCILLDQIRILVWRGIANTIFIKNGNK